MKSDMFGAGLLRKFGEEGGNLMASWWDGCFCFDIIEENHWKGRLIRRVREGNVLWLAEIYQHGDYVEVAYCATLDSALIKLLAKILDINTDAVDKIKNQTKPKETGND